MADACPSCGAAHAPGARFCAQCGTALQQTCPACGAAHERGARFCAQCGTPLAATAATAATGAPAPTPVAERRMVSLLFGDLVGFTTVSEARDPEAVRELLSGYFERCRAIVERYGGVVEKFIGDAVFGVWGVPAAHEDDAERAVRAGLELTTAIAALGEEIGVPGLRMRVGITTGQVAVTLGAVGEGLVAGDAVNTAARVQSVAGPGQVWVDDTTRSLTVAGLAYQPMGSFELKGKAVPVELFHATRTVATVGGEGRVDGLEGEFVGRDRELRLVKELFHQTFDDGRARIVLVAGEPGAGTSRLAWEFEKYVDAIATQVTWWLRGRCLSYGQAAGGRVLADLVRSHLRVTEADGDEEVAAALDRRLEQHFADAADRDDVRPKLMSLLGLSDRAVEQSELFVAIRRTLEAMTLDGSSVTLVVDDLHSADDAFLDFVDHLLEAGRAPIMVLGLTRPELMERRPSLAAGRRATTVFLDRMSDAALAEMLDSMVDGLTPGLRAELVSRSDGMPLYAVETVRALVDRDVIVPRDGRYVLADAAADLTTLGPPASLTALFAARLDALPEVERRVVQDASVLGLTFSRAGIAALSPDGVDVDAALEALRRKEVLALDSDPRSPERGSYRFVQALLRAVAYDTIGRRDKHARHLAAAAHLAGQNDALPAVQAQHLLDARDALPDGPDAGDLVSRAALLLEQAASDALQMGAISDAVRHLVAVLGLPLDDDTYLRFALRLARVESDTQVRDPAVEAALTRGKEIAEAMGDRPAALLFGALLAGWTARRDFAAGSAMALAVYDEAIERTDAVAGLVQACAFLSYANQFLDSEDEAGRQANFDRVMRAALVADLWADDHDFAVLLDALMTVLTASGRARTAIVLGDALARRADPTSPRSIRSLVNNISTYVNDLPLEAEADAVDAVERIRTFGGGSYYLLAAHCHLLFAAGATGHWDLAVRTIADARETDYDQPEWLAFRAAASAGVAWGRRDASLLLPRPAEAHDDAHIATDLDRHRAVEIALAGDLERATSLLVSAAVTMLGSPVTTDDSHPAAAVACDLAVLTHDRTALEQLAKALDVPPGRRRRLHSALVLRLEGLLAREPGLLARSADAYADAGAAYWAAHVRVEQAGLLRERGEDVEDLVAQVVPLLTDIGAVGDLQALVLVQA